MRAIIRCVSGGIGALVVSLTQIAPHAVPDPFAAAVFVATVAVMLLWERRRSSSPPRDAIIGIVRRHVGAAWGI